MKFLKAQGSPDELDALDYGDITWDKPWKGSDFKRSGFMKKWALTSCQRPSSIRGPSINQARIASAA
jgi:hypothetical protein